MVFNHHLVIIYLLLQTGEFGGLLLKPFLRSVVFIFDFVKLNLDDLPVLECPLRGRVDILPDHEQLIDLVLVLGIHSIDVPS